MTAYDSFHRLFELDSDYAALARQYEDQHLSIPFGILDIDLATHVSGDRWKQDATFPQLYMRLARDDEQEPGTRLLSVQWIPAYGAVFSLQVMRSATGLLTLTRGLVGTPEIDGLQNVELDFSADGQMHGPEYLKAHLTAITQALPKQIKRVERTLGFRKRHAEKLLAERQMANERLASLEDRADGLITSATKDIPALPDGRGEPMTIEHKRLGGLVTKHSYPPIQLLAAWNERPISGGYDTDGQLRIADRRINIDVRAQMKFMIIEEQLSDGVQMRLRLDHQGRHTLSKERWGELTFNVREDDDNPALATGATRTYYFGFDEQGFISYADSVTKPADLVDRDEYQSEPRRQARHINAAPEHIRNLVKDLERYLFAHSHDLHLVSPNAPFNAPQKPLTEAQKRAAVEHQFAKFARDLPDPGQPSADPDVSL